MNYEGFKAIEPVGFFRSVAREALRGRWSLALLAGFLYTLLLNIPVVLLDGLFGTPLDMEQMFRLLGDEQSAQTFSQMESQGLVDSLSLPTTSPLSGVYTFLTAGALALGFSIFAIHIVRRAEAGAGLVFSGFGNYFRSLGVTVVVALICMACVLVFVVPLTIIAVINETAGLILVFPVIIAATVVAVVVSLRYSMIYFILADNPGIGVMECLKVSRMMMNGNRGKFFVLILSFIGWFLLYFVVSGIVGGIFIIFAGADALIGNIIMSCIVAVGYGVLISYVNVAEAAFYEKVSGISSGMFNLSGNKNPEQGPDQDQNHLE